MPGIRVVKSRDEFEGEIYESLSVIDGTDLAPHPANAEREEIGKPRPRIDGTQRVSGRAIYTQDLQLPGMGGLTALPLIRRRAPATRIVVFSAFPDPYTLVDVLQLGADGYLNKGTTWQELVPTLAALCQLPSPMPA